MGGRHASVWKLTGLGALSALLYTWNFELGSLLRPAGLVEEAALGLATYPVLTGLLFVPYGLAVREVLRTRSAAGRLGVILGFAVLFRLCLLPAPLVLSNDINRYVWDGRVQTAGVNPYVHPPAAEALAPLRDDRIFPAINRPDARTIYPPGAQALFALVHAVVPDSVTGMKAVMVLFDLATIGVLLLLLHRSGVGAERVLVYAWSPLAIFEIAGSGHAEALMLPFALLALLARREDRFLLAGAALGAATLIKLYPAALLPALYRRGDRRLPLAFGATVVAGYLPYVRGAGGAVLGFLPDYVGPAEDFNVGLRGFLTFILDPLGDAARLVAIGVVSVVLVGVGLFIARDGRGDVLGRAYLMVSAFFVLLPTSLHAWYLVWIVPFLGVHPSWGWLYLSGAVSLSYLKYIDAGHQLWTWPAQFLPLYALLALEAVRHHRRRTWPAASAPLVEQAR